MDKKQSKSKVKAVQAKIDPAKIPKSKKAPPKPAEEPAKPPSRPASATPKPPSRPPSSRPASSRPKSSSRPASKASSRPKSGSRPPSSKPPSAKRPKSAPPKRPPPEKDKEKIAELTEAAIRGKSDQEYPLTLKIVRIFTSSTFTDTKVERNTLMEKVYPKLKVYCQEQGYEFQVVDMRWGVRDEATDDHMTSELCMREIQDCQKLSTGPSFITFLAQKYGYRPFPPRIDSEEFEKILKAIKKSDDKKVVTDWFLKDDNCVPAQYQLQPIREKLTFYADDSQPDKKKKDRDKWWEIFEKIQLVLREAASKALSKEDAHKYFWSVTEEEIKNGILDAENTKEGCFWFRRDISDLQKNVKSKMARRFMDISGDVDKEALDFLTQLKEKKIPQTLPEENVIRYEVKWTENGIDTDASEEHKEYIDKFSEDFERVLKDMIEEGIRERYKVEVDDPLYQECVQHVLFGKSKGQLYHGRQDFLQTIQKKVKDGSSRAPVVICGQAGSGKTTCMGKIFEMIPEWLGEDVPVVVRFVGTTTNSATTRDLLYSLCQQIRKLTDPNSTEELPDNLKTLREYFKELIENLSDPICIIVDSLDQLKDAGKGLREWLPTSLPDGVVFILSSIPGEEFRVVPELKKFLKEDSFVDVPDLTEDDVGVILDELFQQAKRTLQPEQKELLITACQECPLPLYTKIAFDESCRWKSHAQVQEDVLGATVTDLINGLFDKVEKYHGKVLVSHALGYITAARAGLSLGEIEDVLSIDDVALNDIYQYHMPPLRRLPPLLWVRIQADLKDYLVSTGSGGVQVIRWYHRQFHTVATERYLSDDRQRLALHTSLAEYFLGMWANGEMKGYTDKKGKRSEADRFVAQQPLVFKEAAGEDEKTQFNLRKMNELCYHLVKANQVEQAKEHCLCSFKWIYEKMRAVGIFSVLDDYELLHDAKVEDKEAFAIESILELSINGLTNDPNELPCHLLGRLYNLPDYNEKPHIKQLVMEANKPHFDCLIPTVGFLETSGGPFVRKFVGHQAQVVAYGCNEDFTKLVSCGQMENFTIWNMATGEAEKSFPVPGGVFFSGGMSQIYFCNKETYAAMTTSDKLVIVDLESGEAVHMVDVPKEDMTQYGYCYVNQERNIVYACTNSDIVAHDIRSGKEVFKIPRKIPALTQSMYRKPSYIGGLGSHVAYHFAEDNKVQFINDVDYPKKKKVVTMELFNTKDLKLRDSKVNMAMTSDGILAAYILEPARTTDPGYEFKDEFADVKTYDVKTGELLNTIEKVAAGMQFGFDPLLPTGPKTVVYPAYMAGNFYFKEYDLEAGTVIDTLVLEVATMMFLAPGGENQVLFTSVGDMNNIELVDVSKCRKKTDTSLLDTIKKPKTFGLNLLGPLLDSKRYTVYSTLSMGLGVWDLARNACVRHGNAYDNASTAKWVTPTKVMMAKQGKLFSYYDYKDDKFLKQITKQMAQAVEEQCKPFVAVPGEEKIMLVGPNANEISTYDLKKGAVESKITGPKGKIYGGLLASPDFGIILALDNYDKEKHKNDDNKILDFVVSVFEVKTKKPLPGLKFKARNPMTPQTLNLFELSFSKDGKYLATVIDHLPTVWELRTGAVVTYKKKDDEEWAEVVRFLDSEGEIIAGYSNGSVRKFNQKTKKCTMTMESKLNVFTRMKVSPDDKLVACTPNTTNKLHVLDLSRQVVLMTFNVGKQIHDFDFSVDSQFLLLTLPGVEAILPLYVYSQDTHKDDPQEPFPEAKAREPLFDDPDTFGEFREIESKPPEKEKDDKAGDKKGDPKKKKKK